jgi:hypothetical protein
MCRFKKAQNRLFSLLNLLPNLTCCVQPPVADMAIADLTVTSQRNADIDFTLPFMKLGK